MYKMIKITKETWKKNGMYKMIKITKETWKKNGVEVIVFNGFNGFNSLLVYSC